MTTPTVARLKKLINGVEDVVPESLAGLGAAHPNLVSIDLPNRVVLRAGGPKPGKVGLVSGGGSGHEPLHGGFVGLGMLDAACAGHVFTSPTPDQMEAATRAVDGGAGVLHIVKNYTGDVLNFQMAAELVAGEVEVSSVVTNDDVAVQDSLYTAGRRGVGVTVLVEKIAGARAEQGASLAEVTETAVKVNANGRSMGMALSSCVVPAAGTPTFELGVAYNTPVPWSGVGNWWPEAAPLPGLPGGPRWARAVPGAFSRLPGCVRARYAATRRLRDRSGALGGAPGRCGKRPRDHAVPPRYQPAHAVGNVRSVASAGAGVPIQNSRGPLLSTKDAADRHALLDGIFTSQIGNLGQQRSTESRWHLLALLSQIVRCPLLGFTRTSKSSPFSLFIS